MKNLSQFINEKLKLSDVKQDNYYNKTIETFYIGTFTYEQIIDMIDETYDRENHNIILTNHNTIGQEHYCSVEYKNDDDLIKLFGFIEMLFGPTMYNGEIQYSEDMGFYIQDKEIVKQIGSKYQSEIDDIIQNYENSFYKAYRKIKYNK